MRVPNAERTVIDHVIYGVRDLDGALDRFSAELGLEPIARASHHAWGTHNAVIPVGFGQFIELLAIANPSSGTALVNALGTLLARGDRMAGVCLRPVDFDGTVERLSLKVIRGERDEGDRVLGFRRTVVEADPALPFFIDWQGAEREADERYGAAACTHGIAWVEVGGDTDAIRSWIDDDAVPVRVVAGRRGPRRFALHTRTGDQIVIS